MGRNRVIRLDSLEQFQAINVLSDPGAIAGPKIAPNCMQVVIGWGLDDGKTAHNVLGARYSGSFPGSTSMANAIMTALTTGAAWTALAGFLAATPTGIYNVNLRDINSPNQPLVPSSNSGVLGTSASPALPNENAAVITLRTGQTGPANRGRIYIPGWATNALGTGNIIAAGAVTALQNWANTIPTALSAQGLQFVIVQPARNAYTGSTGRQHPARAATSINVSSQPVRDNHWDTQRRRGIK